MTVHTLAEGIGFTEGPLVTRDGRLFVVSLSRGLVVEIDPDGGVLTETETGGGPNGLAEDADGRIWVAQNGGAVRPSRSERPTRPGLQRLDGPTVVDVPIPGTRAPNDLVAGPDGRLWFTDPGPPGDTGHGRVLAHDPVGGTTETLLDEQDFPNGLVFDATTDTLHLAHTDTGLITAHHWDGARLRPTGTSVALPEVGPDGLALDARGLLYAAAPAANAVFVLSVDGHLHRRIDFDGPTFPTNLCLAGPRHDRLVVTAAKGGRVLALPVDPAG
ncbi:SMP-30/gluconolactonase/LRE family protein [Actinomycetospora termitidis]|uniref:SMP-30/gluconolactonase/LRE family protein n=1 Tax=Actinomycetospora termitidis TaxID=3053470 RepID=A0ABT7M4K7_9PSEU|nr:SMP-30/gluconolactonase/LRE family protein [Actinomycetospora sp. Odt1-22]MDL5155610.1 SMP-30/gluconolactonase/LRE family protein [Actinomycetospora sp. Odt1-22]